MLAVEYVLGCAVAFGRAPGVRSGVVVGLVFLLDASRVGCCVDLEAVLLVGGLIAGDFAVL